MSEPIAIERVASVWDEKRQAVRLLCLCGRSVLTANWTNHLLRQDSQPHDFVRLAATPAAEPGLDVEHDPYPAEAAWSVVRDMEHWRTAGEFEDALHGLGFCVARLRVSASEEERR